MPRKVTAAKHQKRAGATPLLGASSRPKYRGIAPARPELLGAVFWPRAGVGQFQVVMQDVMEHE